MSPCGVCDTILGALLAGAKRSESCSHETERSSQFRAQLPRAAALRGAARATAPRPIVG